MHYMCLYFCFKAYVFVWLQCTGAYCFPDTEELPQKLEIISSVTFVDASQSSVSVSAQTPTVTAKLPDDFFYPFV